MKKLKEMDEDEVCARVRARPARPDADWPQAAAGGAAIISEATVLGIGSAWRSADAACARVCAVALRLGAQAC